MPPQEFDIDLSLLEKQLAASASTSTAAGTSQIRKDKDDIDFRKVVIQVPSLNSQYLPVLRLQSADQPASIDFIPCKLIENRCLFLLTPELNSKGLQPNLVRKDEVNDLPAEQKEKLKGLHLYSISPAFKDLIDNPDANQSTPLPLPSDKSLEITLRDWLEGFSSLHPKFLYGDNSDFAVSLKVFLLENKEGNESTLNLIANRHHTSSYEKKLCLALEKVRLGIKSAIKDKSQANTDASHAIQYFSLALKSFRELLGSASHGVANTNLEAVANPAAKANQYKATTDSENGLGPVLLQIANKSSGDPAFQILLRLVRVAVDARILQPVRSETDSPKFAAAPILLFSEKNLYGGKNGAVYWFSVELFSDAPGTLIPDLFSLGLTDARKLTEGIMECWAISGLAQQYRGIFRLTAKFPEKYAADYPDFRNYVRNHYFNDLGGKSCQAAVLAALWAASGEVPLISSPGKPEVLRLNGESLRLDPRIAITSAINTNNVPEHKAAIPLAPVEDDSIRSKVEALSIYSPSRNPEDSLFDTAIVVGSDVQKVREKFSLADETKLNYRGIRIREDCKTMEDALEWLLEINTWSHAWHKLGRDEWESLWAYAYDEKGRFLRANKKGFITVSNHDPRIIRIGDDQRLEVIPPDDPKANSPTHTPTEEELTRRVEELGINTGSFAYLQNPVGGAVETFLDSSADTPASATDEEVRPEDV